MLPLTYQLHAAAKLLGCVLEVGFLPVIRDCFSGLVSAAAASVARNRHASGYARMGKLTSLPTTQRHSDETTSQCQRKQRVKEEAIDYRCDEDVRKNALAHYTAAALEDGDR